MALRETLIDLTVHDIRLAQNALVSLKRELPIEGTSPDFSRDAAIRYHEERRQASLLRLHALLQENLRTTAQGATASRPTIWS